MVLGKLAFVAMGMVGCDSVQLLLYCILASVRFFGKFVVLMIMKTISLYLK